MRFTILALLATLLFAGAHFVSADDKKPEGPKSEPKGLPLEMRIKGTAKYTLSKEAADSYRKFEELRKEPDKAKGPVTIPPTPVVDLKLEIVNTSDKPVRIYVGGDPVTLLVTLKGDGALNLVGMDCHTEEYRQPHPTEIAAGGTYTIPLSLKSGFRGDSNVAYWTAAGDYEVVVTLDTAMNPAPAGVKVDEDGYGRIKLTSAVFPVKVEMEK